MHVLNNWVFWGAQIVATIIIGILAFFLKRTFKNIDDIKKEQEEYEKEFNNFKTNMPFVYTLREDFIRVVAGFDNKLDKILDRLSGGSK
jgi:uncharacterized membrane-anchored protein YhcB (DUF1043 family)